MAASAEEPQAEEPPVEEPRVAGWEPQAEVPAAAWEAAPEGREILWPRE